MSPEIRDLVDRRWAEYGIPTQAEAALVQNGASSRLRQLLRR